jgi:hypothetical protein
MSDNEKDQNDAGDRDDHFLSNGRAIKSGDDIHDRFGARRGTPHASDYERCLERQDRKRLGHVSELIRIFATAE